MTGLIIVIFVVGYLAITLEHPLRLNKTSSALFTGILIWIIYALQNHEVDLVNRQLSEHLEGISQILFFLMGAMTIVELIDAHQGFSLITNKIKTKNKRKLLFIISISTFLLSSILDNLTTTIVMVSLLKKLIDDNEQRKLYAGMVIIAANAGGAWSPIGDVTTTMLWLGGQISSVNIMKYLFLPSIVCCIVPALLLSIKLKGDISIEINKTDNKPDKVHGGNLILFCGMGALVFVPIFKTITHLPPYLGMLFGLAFVWLISEIIHYQKDDEEKKPLSAAHALSRIDTSSILFFLGILLAVGGLQSLGILKALSGWMDATIGNQDVIVVCIGLISAVIDNVPLVAATMGMYDLATFPMDHKIWEFLAYCAGTGGSILILGSAAGVAVLGMEKIDFFWYVKKISFVAFVGYIAGALVYLAVFSLIN